MTSTSSNEHPTSSTAQRLKELVKAKAPITVDEFICIYMKEFRSNRKNLHLLKPFLEDVNLSKTSKSKNSKNIEQKQDFASYNKKIKVLKM
jgi:hypothetical protein